MAKRRSKPGRGGRRSSQNVDPKKASLTAHGEGLVELKDNGRPVFQCDGQPAGKAIPKLRKENLHHRTKCRRRSKEARAGTSELIERLGDVIMDDSEHAEKASGQSAEQEEELQQGVEKKGEKKSQGTPRSLAEGNTKNHKEESC